MDLFAGPVHLAVIEDKPSERIIGVSLDPPAVLVPPVSVFRQYRDVAPESRDQNVRAARRAVYQSQMRDTIRLRSCADARRLYGHLRAVERLAVFKRCSPSY